MSQLLPYLQLCRFAAVFTALADIFLGYALAHRTLEANAQLGWLLLASAGLYLSGMVFNDVFDRKIDAVERPKRPIPSGRVSVRSAIIFAAVLMLTGCAAAAMAGRASLLIASLLAICIFAYDGGLKKNAFLGPMFMAECRQLNIFLGVSAAFNSLAENVIERVMMPTILEGGVLLAAGGMATYIFGVTVFAHEEAGKSRKSRLLIGTAVIDIGLALLVALVLLWPNATDFDTGWRAAVILGFIAFNLNRRLISVVHDPTPVHVQSAVRTLLLSIITLDATLVFFVSGDMSQAMVVLSLLAPALVLGTVLAIT